MLSQVRSTRAGDTSVMENRLNAIFSFTRDDIFETSNFVLSFMQYVQLLLMYLIP